MADNRVALAFAQDKRGSHALARVLPRLLPEATVKRLNAADKHRAVVLLAKRLDAVVFLFETLRHSQPRAFTIAPCRLLKRLRGGRGSEQGRHKGLTIALAQAQGIVCAHNLDRGLLDARDKKVGQRPALQPSRPQKKDPSVPCSPVPRAFQTRDASRQCPYPSLA